MDCAGRKTRCNVVSVLLLAAKKPHTGVLHPGLQTLSIHHLLGGVDSDQEKLESLVASIILKPGAEL